MAEQVWLEIGNRESVVQCSKQLELIPDLSEWAGRSLWLEVEAFTVQSGEVEDFQRASIALPDGFANMVSKRRSEYLAGRRCARTALQQLGLTPVPDIPAGADRSPQWPSDVAGSISHSDGIAAAVVAYKRDISHLGLDLERCIAADIYPTIQQQILIDKDRQIPHAMRPEQFLTLLFSAKEALFKAIFPDVRYIFGFEAAGLVSLAQDRLILELQQDLAGRWEQGRQIEVHYHWQGDLVTTLVAIPARTWY